MNVSHIVFKYEERLEFHLSSTTIRNDLEMDFVKSGIEWSINTMDSLLLLLL